MTAFHSNLLYNWGAGGRPAPGMATSKEQVFVERLIAGMRAVIDELSPEDRQRAIDAIRAVDRDIARRLETPPNKTH